MKPILTSHQIITEAQTRPVNHENPYIGARYEDVNCCRSVRADKFPLYAVPDFPVYLSSKTRCAYGHNSTVLFGHIDPKAPEAEKDHRQYTFYQWDNAPLFPHCVSLSYLEHAVSKWSFTVNRIDKTIACVFSIPCIGYMVEKTIPYTIDYEVCFKLRKDHVVFGNEDKIEEEFGNSPKALFSRYGEHLVRKTCGGYFSVKDKDLIQVAGGV